MCFLTSDWSVPFLAIFNNGCADLAAALQNPHDGGLVFHPCSGDSALPLRNVHVSRLSTDEGLVYFNLSSKLDERFGLHSLADSVEHEPCRLLGDVQIAGDFIGTDTVLAVSNHPHRSKPLVQPERRILKDSSDLYGELAPWMFVFALPESAWGNEVKIGASTRRTGYTGRPATSNDILKAVVGIGKVNDCFLQGLRFLARGLPHGQNHSRNPFLSQVYFYPS